MKFQISVSSSGEEHDAAEKNGDTDSRCIWCLSLSMTRWPGNEDCFSGELNAPGNATRGLETHRNQVTNQLWEF